MQMASMSIRASVMPVLISVALTVSCDETAVPPEEGHALSTLMGKGLRRGDSGSSVRALHSFLTESGYFENPRLRDQHEGWTPVVKSPPPDASSFGDRTEEAVRAYQRLNGLAQSGVADDDTVTAMVARRCGHPDSDPTADDRRRKWDVLEPFSASGKSNYTYRITAYPSTPAADSVDWEVSAAFREWERVIARSFTRVVPTVANPNPTVDIAISWGTTTTATAGAQAFRGSGPQVVGSRIVFNNTLVWSVGSGNDIGTFALHEIGHVLGIEHSSARGAVMNAMTPGVLRTLTVDDIVAVSSGLSYGPWEEVRGRGKDIAANGFGNVWVVGTDATVWQWDESILNWRNVPFPRHAKFIAVGPLNRPWVIATDDTIWRYGGGSWDQKPGTAVDIGVAQWFNPGGQEETYIISHEGCLPNTDGCIIKHWNPALAGPAGWVSIDGRGSRIAVGPEGYPWVVQPSGAIYRMVRGVWERLDGAGWDIAVGMNGTAYVIGRSGCDIGGTCDVYVYNDQRQIPNDMSSPPAADVGRWRRLLADRGPPVKLFYITAGLDDTPWGTNGSRVIWRQVRR
jgi:peptidoglycan hydrolase-like protein with peptidoglycan-binding domain